MTAPDAGLGERLTGLAEDTEFVIASILARYAYGDAAWTPLDVEERAAITEPYLRRAREMVPMLAPLVAEEVAAAEVRALREALVNEQARRCSYATREGDGRTCDCKFANPLRPNNCEATGCPEMRAAIWTLDAELLAANADRGQS